MGATLILYGSRARGEAHSASDVDLILSDEGISLKAPVSGSGVSLHFYPKQWLISECSRGSLFAYHVAFEGIALHDLDEFLPQLREAFRRKSTYRNDQIEALMILRMLIASDWRDNSEARRRYFWALRSILICQSADNGTPRFSSRDLEKVSKISGICDHIESRDSANFDQCQRFGHAILGAFDAESRASPEKVSLRDHLVSLGGIASDSVRVIEEREAVNERGHSLYM